MLQGTPHRRDIDEACAAFGIPAGSVEGRRRQTRTCNCGPEHATPLAIFQCMAGQWRMGPGGPIALDYTALPVVCARCASGQARCAVPSSCCA